MRNDPDTNACGLFDTGPTLRLIFTMVLMVLVTLVFVGLRLVPSYPPMGSYSPRYCHGLSTQNLGQMCNEVEHVADV